MKHFLNTADYTRAEIAAMLDDAVRGQGTFTTPAATRRVQ